MPELYRLASAVTTYLEHAHQGDMMALLRAKGELATHTGFLVALITPNDPDDAHKVQRLREAIVTLGLPIH